MPGDQHDARRDFQRHHAGIMHGRDAAADDGAAERDGPAVKAVDSAIAQADGR